jgi:DNA-binding NarL/FixJ family response regulator
MLMADIQPRIRVFCVDDHRVMLDGLALLIGRQPDMEVVGSATHGEQAVESVARMKPDVTLMDLQLPSVNGHEAIKAIRSLQPDARIVVLTMYYGDEDVYRAIAAGVMGYILKDAVPDDLIHVIREVHAGRRSIPAEIEAVLDARAMQPSLTVREFQVLQLLATGKRNKEIASALGISADTTNAHVKSIFQKFNVHDRTAALGEAIRRGIIHIT